MTNYIIHNKTLYSVLFLCHNFSIPSDVSKIIYDFLLQKSAQNIIDKWYSYVNIHNTNLVKLVLNLKKKTYFNNITGSWKYYYNVTDIHVYNTFKICIKYIKPSISSKNWWIEHIQYLFNGFYLFKHVYRDYFSTIVFPVLQILHDLN